MTQRRVQCAKSCGAAWQALLAPLFATVCGLKLPTGSVKPQRLILGNVMVDWMSAISHKQTNKHLPLLVDFGRKMGER